MPRYQGHGGMSMDMPGRGDDVFAPGPSVPSTHHHETTARIHDLVHPWKANRRPNYEAFEFKIAEPTALDSIPEDEISCNTCGNDLDTAAILNGYGATQQQQNQHQSSPVFASKEVALGQFTVTAMTPSLLIQPSRRQEPPWLRTPTPLDLRPQQTTSPTSTKAPAELAAVQSTPSAVHVSSSFGSVDSTSALIAVHEQQQQHPPQPSLRSS
ncbi:hypothetical protein KC343_g1078 [Hortaea werneckii]|nr:hypothetical protein KC323_g6680 [Hortaea werneckii]KAI6867936.1 hypothetical protein KC338_g4215 [Hortaea werneckii]KAI7261834.1 hypothetical protein KC352_g9867 [Hortaea werneckii]KAI7348515.1 hypothetical protein KC320_g6596 [Hortaea werneckii]KAI7571994.1 hypothetical protein KC317_g1152 [Hortaea werneckii]